MQNKYVLLFDDLSLPLLKNHHPLHFFGKSFPFLFPFLCCLCFGTFPFHTVYNMGIHMVSWITITCYFYLTSHTDS
jgi:hypothetical protein